jgi:hypothetical protein
MHPRLCTPTLPIGSFQNVVLPNIPWSHWARDQYQSHIRSPKGSQHMILNTSANNVKLGEESHHTV